MSLQDISGFFERIKKRINKDVLCKQAVLTALHEEVAPEIDDSHISIKGTTIYFNVHPSLKNKMFLKKHLILEKINSAQSSVIFRDIR